MRKLINILFIVLLGFGIFGCAKKSMEQRVEWILKKVARRLDLNKMQEEKMWAVKNKYFEIRKGKKEERLYMHKEFDNMILSKNLKESDVRAFMAKSRKIQDDYIPEVFPYLKDFQSSLSEKQKNEAVKWLKQIRERFDL